VKRFLLVFLPLLIAWGTAIAWCIDRWNAPTLYFEHCWLVPFVAAVVIWSRRARWSTTLAVPDRRGWLLLGPALLLHLAGALLMIDSLSAAGLILAVPGAAWLALGPDRLRGLWPALWLVLFTVPVPIYVEGRLAFELKEFAVDAGSWLANALGADLSRAGATLHLRGTGQSLFVADECGGLRSLLAMATIGYCVAFFVGSASVVRRIVLLLAALPLAIAANVARIALLCLFARWFGVPFAEGTGHTVANVAEWLFDLAGLFVLDAWLSRSAPLPQKSPALPGRPPAGAPSLLRLGLLLWLCAVPLTFLSLYRPGGLETGRAARLPVDSAGFQLVPRTEAQQREFVRSLPRWIELLGTPDFVWRQHRAANGEVVNLTALFHDANWKSVHAPRICIEGSNMDIEIDDEVAADWLASGATASRIVAKSRVDGRHYLTLSVFGTKTWSSGSYGEFFWHHLPLAMLRRSQSGFLLRAETPVGRGEDLALAERRCAAFLGDLVPAARGLLR